MLNLRKNDIVFIENNIGNDSILLRTNKVNEFLDSLYDWIDLNGFDETGENYNDLGREAQKIYDYVYANCQYIHLKLNI